MNTISYTRFNIFIISILFFTSSGIYAQSLIDNPCNLPSPASAEWSLNSACIPVSTAGMSNLFNPGSCNSAAMDDGWAWFTGDGNSITINFDADAGFDPVIHLFEVTAPCSVTEIACADNTLDGGIETMSTVSTLGQVYFIRIQDWNTNTTMTGCLEVLSTIPVINLTDNPCSLPPLSEWTIGAPCNSTSTTGFTHLFDPQSCGNGLFNDGWAWYTGTGQGNTITYTADPGVDIMLHLFEADLSSGCGVTQIACVNDNGAGGTETIIGGGTLGQIYFIRIQSVGSNTVATGCLGIINNPASCSDGIQNGTETGIDCGGACPAPCPPPPSLGTDLCSNTTNTSVGEVTCSVLGTPFFDALTGLVDFNGLVQSGAPSPTPGCGPNWNGSGNYASWAKYDLDPGITAASLATSNTGTMSGGDDVFIAYYQGTDCNNLTLMGCETFLSFTAPSSLMSVPVMATGLNSNLPLWVLTYSNDPFNLTNIRLNGFTGIVSNTVCSSAFPASLNGCNVGAVGAAFTPPTVALGNGACSGGIWSSNENTVFYEFTPSATNATLEVDDVNCNGDVGGLAQFGIWESCADVGTYGSAFLGCVVGDGVLSLSGMTIGQTYILVFDGNAGDLCRWEFQTTGGIILEVDIISFNAQFNGESVDLDWISKQEVNGDYYIVEKSTDGVGFEPIIQVSIKTNNSSLSNIYHAEDKQPLEGINYYRLKYLTTDGSIEYSPIKAVEIMFSGSSKIISPNPLNRNQSAFLLMKSNFDEKIMVDIFNTTGVKMSSQSYNVSKGFNKILLNTNKLPSGVFLVSVGNKNAKTNIRFVKK